MTETNADPRALHVAREVHMEHQPLAIILFGSRARGDHDEDRSDIDLLVVTKEETAAMTHAVGQALMAYGRRVPVNLLWITTETLEDEEQHINTASTRAMLEGVLFAAHPERFRIRYGGQNPPLPRYDWSSYRWDPASARQELDHMILVLQHNGRAAGKRISGMLPAAVRQAYVTSGADLDVALVQPRALYAMLHALRAAVAGTGEIPRNFSTVTQLLDRAETLAPGEDLATSIPLQEYLGLNALDRMSPEEFGDRVEADVLKIRRLAMKLRSRTGRGG